MAFGFIGAGSGMGRNGKRLDIAPLQELRGYWEGLRVGGRLPARDEIEPRGIAGALENAFILERITPHLARFKLCGMQLHDIMGMEPAGMPLSVMFDPAGRERIAKALAQLFDTPSILEMTLEAEGGLGKPALSGRMMILPLTDKAGKVTRGIGGLVFAGEIGRTPRRFSIATLMTEALPQPAPLAESLREETFRLAEFAEPPANYAPPPRVEPGKPHLRLVSSRD